MGEDPPTEREIISTPSAIASSNAARISALKQPSDQHILYTAMRAEGTPPLAVPEATPSKLASSTMPPAAVDAVCVPWPLASLADSNSPSGTLPLLR